MPVPSHYMTPAGRDAIVKACAKHRNRLALLRAMRKAPNVVRLPVRRVANPLMGVL